MLVLNSCTRDPLEISVRTHTTTVEWFRDAGTSNPKCFIDFYNGKAYTMAQAAAMPDSVDIFISDRSEQIVSGQSLSLVNLIFFSNNNYPTYDSFRVDVGILPLSVYNASTVSEVPITAAEFNTIATNTDIENLFSSKALNGGYTDIEIAAVDLNSTSKYYQFYCEGVNKRGFFKIVSNSYNPGNSMTISIKVEK